MKIHCRILIMQPPKKNCAQLSSDFDSYLGEALWQANKWLQATSSACKSMQSAIFPLAIETKLDLQTNIDTFPFSPPELSQQSTIQSLDSPHYQNGLVRYAKTV